ncbi:MAG: hypothetical protein IJ593_08520 [Lachnospiraceae bacterium]|nr:hypothetical protein [Lachnospiraceae bacterium]
MKRNDLTGLRFGKLTVVDYLGDKRYLCQCDCGNTKDFATYSLTSGQATSCGCNRLKYNIEGQRFGKLVAEKFVGDGKWLCKCDCGNEIEVLTNRLITGVKTSCGHSAGYDMLGEKYGDWTVIGVGQTRDSVICRCSCGVEREVSIYNLKSGASKSCGHATNAFKDLTGLKFGKLLVISYNAEDKKYLCKCDCGREAFVKRGDLTSGNTKSCGNCNRIPDLTGQTFGELTVIKRIDVSTYLCRCSCGVEKEVQSYSLVHGGTRSCGHIRLVENNINIGDKFGELTVIERLTPARFMCKCSCGNTIEVNTNRLLNKNVRSCGHVKETDDLTGKQFGDWTVLKRDDKPRYWICKCSCDNIKSVQDYSLTHGTSTSCGHSKFISDSDNESSKYGISIGQHYGDWEVIGGVKDYKVMCRCSCGKEREVNIYTLKSGKSTGCGHAMNKDRIIDLTGQKFGELTVLGYVDNQQWKCKCSCGNIVIKHRNHLLDGRAKSCGHDTNKLPENLAGQRFGKLTATSYFGNKSWVCKCDCGNTKIVASANLKNGSTVSCGCINHRYTKSELIELSDKYYAKYNERPTVSGLAEFCGVTYGVMRYHLEKFDLNHSIYIDMHYTSEGEKELTRFIKSIYNGDVKRCVKDVIPPYELDIYIPELKLAIEYNGNFWHSDNMKDKNYHLNKTIMCGKLGIRLIHVFEYEWKNNNQKEKIKSLINNLINKNKNILYARDLVIKEIENSEAVEFCNKYHLQNGINSKINIGLFKDNELVQLMTFGTPRFSSGYQYEMLRLATKSDYYITGGSERLFNYFVKKYNPSSVVSYCNLSKFRGDIYFKLGFKFCGWGTVEPNYVWCDGYGNDVLTRYQTMKHLLVEKGLGTDDQTEDEIMESLGYLKIYDCGNLKFVWTSDNT